MPNHRYCNSQFTKKMSKTLRCYSKNVISSMRNRILYSRGRGDGDKMVKDCRSTSTAVLFSHTHTSITLSIIYCLLRYYDYCFCLLFTDLLFWKYSGFRPKPCSVLQSIFTCCLQSCLCCCHFSLQLEM